MAGEKAAAALEAVLEVAAEAALVLVPEAEPLVDEARVADEEAAELELAAAELEEAREEVAADDEAAEVDEAPAAAPELELDEEAAAFRHELSDELRTTRGEA